MNKWYINPNTSNYQLRIEDGRILTVDFESAHGHWIDQHPLVGKSYKELQQWTLESMDKDYWMTRIGNGAYFV